MRVNIQAFLVAIGLLVFNFVACWLGSPYLYVEPTDPRVIEFAWASANASTLSLAPFVLLFIVAIWPRQRS